jgi:hypothetical protein
MDCDEQKNSDRNIDDAMGESAMKCEPIGRPQGADWYQDPKAHVGGHEESDGDPLKKGHP